MATPYVTLPGTTGRYAARTDVNLLDADTAHLHQSVGTWEPAALGGLGTIELSQDIPSPLEGAANVGKVEIGAGATSRGVKFDIAVSASTTYATGLWIYSEVAIPNFFLDTIGDSSGYSYGGGMSHGGTGWEFIPRTAALTTDGSDTTLGVFLYLASDDANAYTLYISKVMFCLGSDPTFVPSLRIVGDLDLRVDIAPTEWDAAGSSSGGDWLTRWDQGFWFYQYPAGKLFSLSWRDAGGTQRSATSNGGVPHTLADGERAIIRCTVDVDNGASGTDVDFYINGVAEGATQTVAATGLQAGTTNALNFGSRDGTNDPFDGDVYWAEVRDGIDGPVVARFDGSDALIAALFGPSLPNGTTWVDSAGGTWESFGADITVDGEFALTDYAETELADHIVGTGAYTSPADIYIKLHTGDPGESAALNAATETTRKVITFSAAVDGEAVNDSVATWLNVAATEIFTHWSIWDNISAGNPLVYGELDTPVAANAGDTIELPIGGLSIFAR